RRSRRPPVRSASAPGSCKPRSRTPSSLAAGPYAKRSPDGAKTPPADSKAAEERPGHDAMVAAVAAELHVSTARVSAALQPLFAAGHADTSSPSFAAAARALGVSTNQLDTALMHAKQSLAQSS